MNDKQKISAAEWLVMNVVWDRNPATAKDIIFAVTPKTGWKPKTVKTLIGRLVLKQKIRHEAQGKAYKYYPAVSRADCIDEEQATLLDRIFKGSPKEMIISLIKNSDLTPLEIGEIRSALDTSAGGGTDKQETTSDNFDICL